MNYQNKKVTLIGLGVFPQGSGISAAKYLLKQGAKLTITDLKTHAQLKDQIKRLKRYESQIKYVLGEHRSQDVLNADLIVRNPLVPNRSQLLNLARKHQIPIETDISIFFKLVDRKRLIGITGTRGKSTTTSLIHKLISTQYPNSVLGGNITCSPLAQLSQINKGGPVVLELSSWLTESLEPYQLSPHIAVFTNVYPDHLNTYADMTDYVQAKSHIFKWQNPQDYLVINKDNKYTNKIASQALAQRYWFSLDEFAEQNGCFVKRGYICFRQDGQEQRVVSLKDIQIPGEHNVYNTLAAVCVAMIYGIAVKNIVRGVKSFTGIADRLELVKTDQGVKYYNDTTSTTPEALSVALKSLGRKRNIVLLAGGSDKGLKYDLVIPLIKQHVKSLVLFEGTGTDKLLSRVKKIDKLPITVVRSMVQAVGIAKSMAKKGDIILLSPGFASFGLFINEFDRGNQFKKLI